MRLIILLLFSCQAFGQDNWFCESQSGKRDGATFWICGMGDGLDEGAARAQALKDGLKQFTLICEASSDCRETPRTVSPQRMSCKVAKNGLWTCVRLLVVTLLK